MKTSSTPAEDHSFPKNGWLPFPTYRESSRTPARREHRPRPPRHPHPEWSLLEFLGHPPS